MHLPGRAVHLPYSYQVVTTVGEDVCRPRLSQRKFFVFGLGKFSATTSGTCAKGLQYYLESVHGKRIDSYL